MIGPLRSFALGLCLGGLAKCMYELQMTGKPGWAVAAFVFAFIGACWTPAPSVQPQETEE